MARAVTPGEYKGSFRDYLSSSVISTLLNGDNEAAETKIKLSIDYMREWLADRDGLPESGKGAIRQLMEAQKYLRAGNLGKAANRVETAAVLFKLYERSLSGSGESALEDEMFDALNSAGPPDYMSAEASGYVPDAPEEDPPEKNRPAAPRPSRRRIDSHLRRK